MVGEEKPRKVVVDTYALLAMAYGELGADAVRLLQGVRRGRVKGLIPATVVYEYVVHWLRGRIPVLESIEEVLTFLTRYFTVTELSLNDWVESAKIKHRGDELLRASSDPLLRARRLSLVDSTIIATAMRYKAPIITGDRDLGYVASSLGLKVIW